MFRLQRLGAFAGHRSLLDLGPQDIQISKPYLIASLLRNLGKRVAPPTGLFVGDTARRDGQAAYYSLFGIEKYKSADFEDDRTSYRLDLNQPISGIPEFDVVTDFGTAEHVFDIAQVFRTIHGLLRPGGLALHVVPSFAFSNHGFYTPNPNLFVEFARTNGYRILDFCYVDNMFVRERLQAENPEREVPFDALPILMRDMENTQVFGSKIARLFYKNIIADDTRGVLEKLSPAPTTGNVESYPAKRHHLCFIFDLMFVALVKPLVHRTITAPIQRMEGVLPLAE